MNDRYVTEKLLEDFSSQLRAAGCAQGTAENYLRHVRAFARWLEGGEATGEAAAGCAAGCSSRAMARRASTVCWSR